MTTRTELIQATKLSSRMGPPHNYQFPTHNAPPAVAAQNGQASQLYVTHSETVNHGTWLFPPDQFGGGNN